MKIAVITARFSVSGVPLAQIRLATAWQSRGHDVACVFGWLGDGALRIPEGLERIDLGATRVIRMLPALIAYLRREQPEIIFSAEDHLNAVVLLAAILSGSKAKICCSSRVTPFDTYSSKPLSKRWLLKWAMRAVMRRADVLSCVSEGMVAQYAQVFPGAGHVCVYNIVDPARSRQQMAEPVDLEWFSDPGLKVVVGAGSLEPWKGFHDLIRAMTLAPANARLLILGEGSRRSELQQLITSQGLEDRAMLYGRTDNPLKFFSQSQVFVLSSSVEGMPNVLVEAMMCGCTPVSTDCETGPRELLADRGVGTLVPVGDWRAIGEAISFALEHPTPPDKLENAIAPFSETAVLREYARLLALIDNV